MTDQPHSGPSGPWSGSGEAFSEPSEVSPTDRADATGYDARSDDEFRGSRLADSDAGRADAPAPSDEQASRAPFAAGFDDTDDREPRGGAATADDTDAGEGRARPRRRSRGGRGRRKRRTERADAGDEPGEDGPETEAPDDLDERDPEEGADGSAAASADEDGVPKKRRRRGSRGGRRRRKTRASAPLEGDEDDEAVDDDGALSVDAIPGEDDDLSTEAGEDEGGEARRSAAPRKRRRRKKKRAVELGEDAHARRKSTRRASADELEDEAESEPEGGSKRKRRRRKKKRGEGEVDDELAAPRAEVVRDQVILVNAADPEETRVVVQQDDRIVDLVMSVNQHKTYVNDIYRGRVVNIEDAIGAAFVDFGQGRNGFLHASDVMHIYGDEDWRLDKLLTARTDAEEWQDDARGPSESIEEGSDEPERPAGKGRPGGKKERGRGRPRGRKRKSISELLKRGQLVVAQITKDAIGDKGPTLTTYISIPGRYLVLMPSLEKTGVSRKIDDERERRRLKRILQSLDIPAGMGVIVRTAGVGKTKEDIRRDLDYLLAVWDQFSRSLVLGRNPAPLYQESAVSIRTMRDLFSSRTKAVIVDDENVYHEMREFTEKLMPEHLDRIQLHDGPRPLFHTYGVEQDFERLFARRVELPSGGSIVFDQTEALVAIDVNSGRTRDEGADFEDIALKANLEAVPEIARQIKLRDLGGIIVCDFIDMMRPASRRQVEKALRARLVEDRARSKLGRISQFGLLEMTRQRLGPGLSTLLYEPCSYCRGTGRRRTAQSKAQAVLRRLGSALTQKGFTKIEILVHPDTLDWLRKHDWKQVVELEQRSKRELVFVSAEEQYEDSVFHYLRADGREVRPGGRRRR